MNPTRSKKKLLAEMARLFPKRWEISKLHTRFDGNEVSGTIKIHCTADDKRFLSDFDAKMDAKGKIVEFALDGLSLKDKIARLDSE